VELETLKYVSSGYGAAICPTSSFTPPTSPAPCAPAPACGLELARSSTAFLRKTSKRMAAKCGTDDYKWRACLIPCRLVFEKGHHLIPVTGGFLRQECQKLFSYRPLRIGKTGASWRIAGTAAAILVAISMVEVDALGKCKRDKAGIGSVSRCRAAAVSFGAALLAMIRCAILTVRASAAWLGAPRSALRPLPLGKLSRCQSSVSRSVVLSPPVPAHADH